LFSFCFRTRCLRRRSRFWSRPRASLLLWLLVLLFSSELGSDGLELPRF